ncbi:PHD finger protein 7-like [Toxorhynchites rutilus septentrionalis]|uniref:PHD finger protein 7-like n=1 Tax=Toxorhynchites rutilus septentrionalis TaxID=329112 RepID=UPI00247A61E5|nr:PHD finger protein 7-like [Toxorhynchites rutilus septentrionalis]
MNLNEDFLEEEDYFYVGLDRLRFICCRCCSRYTPFLFHLPPSEDLANFAGGLQKDQLTFCPGCLPQAKQLLNFYSVADESAVLNFRLIELMKGFEYSNPYFRKYARLPRLLITIDSNANSVNFNDLECLEPSLRLEKLQHLLPQIHRTDNMKYSGLQEILDVLTVKSREIRDFYNEQKIVPASTSTIQNTICTYSNDATQDMEESSKHSESQNNNESTQVLEPGPTSYIAADSRFKLTVLSSDATHVCDICLLSEKNSLKYGEFIEKQQQKRTLRCHYFCLLSGTYISQKGGDKAGILGFLLKDINDSFKMYRDKICSYCNCRSAAIKCCETNCERWFHYICGYKNNCLTQFVGAFVSYCHEHHPVRHDEPHEEDDLCWICWEAMDIDNPISSIRSICEPNSKEASQPDIAWYHRECLQRFAFEAGYYFKCPNCFDKSFADHARLHGVFVPLRDASWELEQGAFKNIHKRNCTAEDCKLANARIGRKRTQLVGCKACGGGTMHMECAGVDDPNEFICAECMDATFIKLF